MIDGFVRPAVGIIGAEEDLAGAGFRDQVSQALVAKDHRIEIELFEIPAGWLSYRPAQLGRPVAANVGAANVRREVAAPVGGADLHAREAVERPFEDQMRQGDRGLERVADRVRQETIPGQPAAWFQFSGAERLP